MENNNNLCEEYKRKIIIVIKSYIQPNASGARIGLAHKKSIPEFRTNFLITTPMERRAGQNNFKAKKFMKYFVDLLFQLGEDTSA